MKISFTTMGTPGLNIDEIIEAAREYGFDGIDFRVHKDGEISEDITIEEANEIKDKLGNLELPGLLCYNTKIQQGIDEMTDSVMKSLEIAEMLGAKSIRLFSGKLTESETMEKFCDALNNIFEKYKGEVEIYIQNHASGGISCAEALEIAKRVKDKRYGFIFSPEQSYLMGEEYLDLVREITPLVKQIYIADVNEENLYCLIGAGVIPFSKIINDMKDAGFDGYITLNWEKCWRDYLPPYQQGFESFLNYFKKEGIL